MHLKKLKIFSFHGLIHFMPAKEQLQRDEAMRSAGIMLQTMMLSAKAMGYDSCPMVGFDFDKVARADSFAKRLCHCSNASGWQGNKTSMA